MKIATWNVNGIRAREAQVLEWIGREQPDVVCLQELKATRDQIPASLSGLSDYWSYWHGERAYSGVALLVRKACCAAEPVFSHPDFDHETRIVSAPIGPVSVSSIYVPNGGKDFAAKIRFLEAMIGHAVQAAGEGRAIILCGDLNVAHAEIDVHPKERKLTIGQLPEERALFDRLLATGLVDLGRALDPANEELFTWWAPWRNMRQRNIGWRLDYVLASGSIAGRATACPAYRDVGTSDHGPVVATLAI
ncbi:MAG: exodeoxyribonuclease III [Acidobacteria bacterium]|nr:exodeoxyribonuclease III [Acidobacteriota bacterium]